MNGTQDQILHQLPDWVGLAALLIGGVAMAGAWIWLWFSPNRPSLIEESSDEKIERFWRDPR